MTTWLRQSTAVEVALGPFVDDVDGKTPETALTITQPDVRLKKNGAAWGQKNAAQTLAHEENGWYEAALDATDTNTLGTLIVAVYEAGALPVWRQFLIVPINVYDSLIAGSTVLSTSDAAVLAAVDTEVAAIKAKTDNLPAAPAAVSDVPSAAIIASAILDMVNGIETGLTPRQALRLIAAAVAGKLSGAGTATETIRAAVSDTKPRLIATVDASGNRSAITSDVTP